MGNDRLKPDWTRVAFGDVVRLCTRRMSNPATEGVERYVGLEHLESGDLAIRRWGNVADGTTFTTVFRSGQVLFGKRRAYLRKVAVADFNGVCSGDIYVLESRDHGHLLPDLLPFVCQTDGFFDHAVGTSAGSLSPRTNWRSLAAYEFMLPPLDEQRRISTVLQECDRARQALLTLVNVTETVRSRLFDTLLANAVTKSVALGELLTEGPRNGKSAVASSVPTGHWVLGLDALTRFGYRTGRLKPVRGDREMLSAVAQKGDLLISRSNTRDRVGLAGIFSEDRHDVSWPDTMMRLRPDTSLVNTRFLDLYLRASSGRCQIERFAAGTSASMKKINGRAVRQISIALPTTADQEAILRQTGNVMSVGTRADRRLCALRRLRSNALASAL